MVVLSFISMYVLMYAMVDTFANVYVSFNRLYMASLMTAPMVIIELAVMGAMYQNRKMNMAIMAAGVIALDRTIVSGQQAEIDQMKAGLRELDK